MWRGLLVVITDGTFDPWMRTSAGLANVGSLAVVSEAASLALVEVAAFFAGVDPLVLSCDWTWRGCIRALFLLRLQRGLRGKWTLLCDVVDGFTALALADVGFQLSCIENHNSQVWIRLVEGKTTTLCLSYAEAQVVRQHGSPLELGGVILDAIAISKKLTVALRVCLHHDGFVEAPRFQPFVESVQHAPVYGTWVSSEPCLLCSH